MARLSASCLPLAAPLPTAACCASSSSLSSSTLPFSRSLPGGSRCRGDRLGPSLLIGKRAGCRLPPLAGQGRVACRVGRRRADIGRCRGVVCSSGRLSGSCGTAVPGSGLRRSALVSLQLFVEVNSNAMINADQRCGATGTQTPLGGAAQRGGGSKGDATAP